MSPSITFVLLLALKHFQAGNEVATPLSRGLHYGADQILTASQMQMLGQLLNMSLPTGIRLPSGTRCTSTRLCMKLTGCISTSFANSVSATQNSESKQKSFTVEWPESLWFPLLLSLVVGLIFQCLDILSQINGEVWHTQSDYLCLWVGPPESGGQFKEWRSHPRLCTHPCLKLKDFCRAFWIVAGLC